MHFTIWKDAKGRWRWTLRAKNGNIIADCAQGNGYASRRSAVTMCKRINFTFPIRDVDGQA